MIYDFQSHNAKLVEGFQITNNSACSNMQLLVQNKVLGKIFADDIPDEYLIITKTSIFARLKPNF